MRAVTAAGTSAWSATLTKATLVAAPAVATGSTSALGNTSVTIGGTVNPNGAPTQYRFEYRQGSGAWTQQTLADAGSGRVPVSESANLNGLTPSTAYGFRIVAINSAGTSTGSETTFTTAATPPPTAPSGLAGTAATTSVALTWADNSSDETSFDVQTSTTSDFSAGVTTLSRPAGSTSASATGLDPNRTYWFRVRAVRGGATSAWTAALQKTTVAVQPAVATGDTGPVGTTTATIAGTVNPNGASTQYRFEYRQGTGAWTQGPLTDAGSGRTAVSESANLSGLTPATAYGYRIVAVNSAGTSTGTEKTFTTATSPPPVAPDGLAGDVLSSSSIGLTWNDNSSDETGFELQSSLKSDFSDVLADITRPAGTTSYVDDGLTASTAYYYRVRALRGDASSAWSEAITRTTADAPAPPPEQQQTPPPGDQGGGQQQLPPPADPKDVKPPTATATIPAQQLARVLSSGLKIHVRSSEVGTVNLVVLVPKSALGIRGSGRTSVATLTARIAVAGKSNTITVKLSRFARGELKHRGKAVRFLVEAKVADASGNATKVMREAATVKPVARRSR